MSTTFEYHFTDKHELHERFDAERIETAIQKMDEQGWEVLAVLPSTTNVRNNWNFVFKRRSHE